MSDINKYLNKDYFKIGRADNVTLVRNINIASFAVTIIIGLNIIFFLTIYSTTYYSQLDELEDIIKVRYLSFRNINRKVKCVSTTCKWV